jgi:hypothetical protein
MLIVAITYQDIVYFGATFVLVLLGLAATVIYGWWMERTPTCPSPYTGNPMRSGSDLHWLTTEKVLRYLYDKHDYYNRMFDLRKAAVCRETGRIFPDAVNWFGTIKVDWSFIATRYPGNFVSWGSLTEAQKLHIIDMHGSLEGFQTEYSSSKPSPRDVEREYALLSPGPLYVDVSTGILMGWKEVPETELEVLIIQKPIEKYLPGINSKY